MRKLAIHFVLAFFSSIVLVRSANCVSLDQPESNEMTPLEVGLRDKSEDVRLYYIAAAKNYGTRISKNLIDELLGDPSLQVRRMIASYLYLSDDQILRVITSKDDESIYMVIAGRGQQLPAAALEMMVKNGPYPKAYNALLRWDNTTLTEAQAIQIAAKSDLATRFLIANRYKIGDSNELLDLLLRSGQTNDITLAIRALTEIPGFAVDKILSNSDVEVRRSLTLNGKFSPTAYQLQRILEDPDPLVRQGILRRQDVHLSQEQINEGALSNDENLAFSYRQRTEYHPTADMIESGLTSEIDSRRTWFSCFADFVPTAAQIERGLIDQLDSVQSCFIKRANISLTESQIVRALRSSSFPVKQAILQRPDFLQTQARLEIVLLDKNPNILRAFLHKADEHGVDISTLSLNILRTASAQVRIALAKQREIPIDGRLKQIGLQAPEEAVRKAFSGE